MTLSPRISAALLPLPNGAGCADARGLNFPQNHTVDGRVLNLSEAPSARLGVPVRLVRPTYRSHPHAPNVLEEALVSLSRPRRPLRIAVLGLAASAANPQRKVVYVRLCPTLGSWGADPRLGGGAQAYPLRFSAGFAAIDQGAPAAALRPAPPLVVPLPPDLFYPFL